MITSKLKLLNAKEAYPAIIQGVIGRKGVTHLSDKRPVCYIGVEGVSAAVKQLKDITSVSLPSSLTGNGSEAYWIKAVGTDKEASKEMEKVLAGDNVLMVGYFKKSKDNALWFNVCYVQLIKSIDVDFDEAS